MKKSPLTIGVTIALALLLSMTPLPSIAKDTAIAAARVISVNVLNWPAVQNTAEQNTDADGNIKVHEQGQVTVNGAVDISNLPAVQNTTEQNVDANGDIKVHEQGELTVNGAVDVSNLPLDGQGNVKVTGASDISYAVVTLLDNVPCAPSVASSPVSTDGYKSVSLLGKTTSGMQRFAARFQTETGEARQMGYSFQLDHNGVSGIEPIKIPVLGPYLLVAISSCETSSPVTLKAYLTR